MTFGSRDAGFLGLLLAGEWRFGSVGVAHAGRSRTDPAASGCSCHMRKTSGIFPSEEVPS